MSLRVQASARSTRFGPTMAAAFASSGLLEQLRSGQDEASAEGEATEALAAEAAEEPEAAATIDDGPAPEPEAEAEPVAEEPVTEGAGEVESAGGGSAATNESSVPKEVPLPFAAMAQK